MSFFSKQGQVLAAGRLVETLVSEVFDFRRRALEAISSLRSPDRQRDET
jgi:hypothetical protein